MVLEKIMAKRGLTAESLVPYKSKQLNFPELISTSKKVLMELLLLDNDHTIGVLYDTDVDGLYSGYVIQDYLERMGKKVYNYINKNKAHGLNSDSVSWVLSTGITYLFVVDAGSGDAYYIKKLAKQGVTVIVLDHHQYDKWLHKYPQYSDLVHIVNVTDYPELPKLSGCGVVYRFVEELSRQTGINVKVYEKYVGITVISDVCDISCKENRYYVTELYDYYTRYGSKDPFFRNFPYYGSNRTVFGWSIIPYLNAKIRIGEEQEAVSIVNNMSNTREMVKVKDDIRRVKDTQKYLVDKLYDVGKEIVTPHTVLHLRVGYPELGRLSGMVANKMLSENNKNSMVLYKNEQTKAWEGSFRGKSYGLSDIVTAGYWAKGHELACGVRFTGNQLQQFISNFEDTKKDLLDKEPYDITLPITKLTHKDLLEIARFNEVAMEGTPIEPINIKITGIGPLDFSYVQNLEGKVTYVAEGIYFTDFEDNINKSEIIVDVSMSDRTPYYQLIFR